VVGYGAGNGQGGHACPTLIGGKTNNVNHILVSCRLTGALGTTPQQAASLLESTVHRFVPGASAWATKTLNQDLKSGSRSNSQTTWHHIIIQISTSNSPATGQMLLSLDGPG